MKKEDLRKIIREGLSAGIQEGSDGEYMAQQNLNTISMSLEAIQEKIDYSNIPDWVDDKISKIAENMKHLRNYYENEDKEGYKKDVDNMNGVGANASINNNKVEASNFVGTGSMSDVIGVVSESTYNKKTN